MYAQSFAIRRQKFKFYERYEVYNINKASQPHIQTLYTCFENATNFT